MGGHLIFTDIYLHIWKTMKCHLKVQYVIILKHKNYIFLYSEDHTNQNIYRDSGGMRI